MSIEQIAALQPLGLVTDGQSITKTADTGFLDILSSQITDTNEKIVDAQQQVKLLATGEADNLHQVMIAVSKAKTNFELTVEVRNKLLEGFQEVMRMQL